jgi:hypothetical protein
MQSKILVGKWEEPESGTSAVCWEMSDEDWSIIDGVIDWYVNNPGSEPEIGGAMMEITQYEITARGIRMPLKWALEELAGWVRYNTGDEIYAEENPVFKAHGIVLS